MPMPVLEMTGRKFGRLTVLHRADVSKRSAHWVCECECGTRKTLNGAKLREGQVNSCGCLRREIASTRNRSDLVGYLGAHKRVYRIRGRASAHPCAKCGAPATEWAYDHSDPAELIAIAGRWAGCPYSLDPQRYESRCRACHRDLDRESYLGHA